jgi:adenylate cyclase
VSSGDPPNLFTELKRRKVFRVAAVYAGVGFVLAQAADIAFPALRLPEWSVTLVVVLVLIGFPIALVLAWAFEVTPDGLVREAGPMSPECSPPAPRVRGSRGLWVAVGGLAAVGVALLLLGRGSDGRPVAAPGPGGPETIERSIAVLPLLDLSPGGDHEWFTDGITEDILLHLSRIGDLKVIGKTSVMRYKGQETSARQIGNELGVATILVGSLRRDADRVRVSVQHIHAADDRQLWAESWDRDLTDIFRIQSEIARQIVETLQARLSPDQHVRMALAPTENMSAYDLYLRGREHNQRLTRADLAAAQELFREAIRLDPGFAAAHAGLSYSFAAMMGYHQDGPHWNDSASVAARTAVRLDPAGADGWNSLALVQWNTGHFEEAVATYDRVLALRPSEAEAYWGLAFIRWLQGRVPEGLRLAERATELDPGHPGHLTKLGRMWASLGDASRAEESFRSAIALQPDFPFAHQDLLWVLIGTGRFGDAEAHLRSIASEPNLIREYHQNSFLLALSRGRYQEAVEWHQRDRGWIEGGLVGTADVGFALYRAGRTSRAREMLQRELAAAEPLLESSPEDFFLSLHVGRAAAVLGDTDTALKWLEHAADKGWRAYPIIDIARDPVLESLTGDPRFDRLRSRILEDVARMRAEVEGTAGSS